MIHKKKGGGANKRKAILKSECYWFVPKNDYHKIRGEALEDSSSLSLYQLNYVCDR
jgi:hypothetical protein